MGKTYLETIKYMIVADFEVNGLVERPDVIGAIFGQSEGLLGSQLDIKELQQNGKIGRIEITLSHQGNKTSGNLKLPCSLSMVETAIIGASIESIDKVGPCDTSFIIKQIEDTRGLKRKQIKERAISLLGKLMQDQIPDTRELMDEISDTFKTREIVNYGPDRLPAGPTIDASKELIVVEGRADVINMLKYGFTNVISTNGARIPKSLSDICKNKEVTLFLDGDHGGEIQQSQLLKAIRVDYIARAPDGKEVEELTQKEINQALRRKIKSNLIESSITPRQPGLVKQTKFSITHEHKVKQNEKVYNKFKEPIKTGDDFENMLSNIPNVERIDVSKNNFSHSSFNNMNNKRNTFNNKPNFLTNRSENIKSDSVFINNNLKQSPIENNKIINNNLKQSPIENNKIINNNLNVFSKKPLTLKDKVENAVKEFKDLSNKSEFPKKISLENQISSNFSKEQSFLKSNLKPPVSSSNINSLKNINKSGNIMTKNIFEKKEFIKKEEIKEPIKEEKIIIPKITDKMRKNFLKILEDVDGKEESRILNEKLRRIGNSKNKDIINKINSFKSKIFAIVTGQDISEELLKTAINNKVYFIVAPKSKLKDHKEIGIITYNELKK
ncbi:MAG: DNA primase DnaG [Candidatus ainarchaeum sp.]|nr:DNA primase DnaG [Candidatus ainarchaeum sp.]MDD3976171.1 DNA primase DnaG [Candidatus ainarchaeum sp.]